VQNIAIPLGALETEAKAVEAGSIFAWELDLRKIILESDSQVVMQALASSITALVSIQQLITGAKSWLPNFNNWKSRFIHREGNNAAHLLARHSKTISDCTIWVECSPPIIASH